ncbi:hypothetical protein KUL72_12260 [Bradyrhizobium arachidis]|uniref:hypothetical protein n=1 Tax=Bradyrhizobium TaxID=374 RepID=UPI0021634348|nr:MULTISPECIES: hypothetical protein [Bradyrhizobium]MDN4983932.1 hypothetical protein [Bradyrhizobium sp. WYCCWR 13022]UVO39060.1 hypothetical protein KUL72_12260 [Bradyrhizobium arachidis]
MPTTRHPINRPPRSRVTELAIELFKQMQDRVAADVHFELHIELQLKPWQWPANR